MLGCRHERMNSMYDAGLASSVQNCSVDAHAHMAHMHACAFAAPMQKTTDPSMS